MAVNRALGSILSVAVSIVLAGTAFTSLAQTRTKSARPAAAAAAKPAPAKPAPVSAAIATAVKALIDQAERASGAGNHADALKSYEAAIGLSPNDPDLYTRRGGQQSFLGQNDLALADYERAIKLDPTFAKAYLYRAYLRDKPGSYAEALADADLAVKYQPDYPDAWHERQRLVLFADEASLSPVAKTLYDLAYKQWNTDKNAAAALATSDNVMKIVPNSLNARFQRGLMLFWLGRYDESFKQLMSAAELDPLNDSVWSMLATVKVKQGDDLSALIYYAKSISLDPLSASHFDARGRTNARLGNNVAAAADFKKAVALDGSNQGYRDHLNEIQPKAQADIAAATPRPTLVAAGGRSCHDILNDLIEPVNIGRPPAIEGSYTMARDSEQKIWGMLEFIRAYNTLPVCRSDSESIRIMSTTLEDIRTRCRGYGGSSCTNGAFPGTAAQLQQERAEFDRIIAANSQTVGSAVSSPGNLAENQCYARTTVLTKQIDAVNRMPGLGAVQLLEAYMWYAQQTTQIIDSTCPGGPSFVPIKQNMAAIYPQALDRCRAVSTTGSCAPRLPPGVKPINP